MNAPTPAADKAEALAGVAQASSEVRHTMASLEAAFGHPGLCGASDWEIADAAQISPWQVHLLLDGTRHPHLTSDMIRSGFAASQRADQKLLIVVQGSSYRDVAVDEALDLLGVVWPLDVHPPEVTVVGVPVHVTVGAAENALHPLRLARGQGYAVVHFALPDPPTCVERGVNEGDFRG